MDIMGELKYVIKDDHKTFNEIKNIRIISAFLRLFNILWDKI